MADTLLRVNLVIPTLKEAATRLGAVYSALVEESKRGYSGRLPLEGSWAFPGWIQPKRYRTGGFGISSEIFRALDSVYGRVGKFGYPDTKAYSDDLHVFMRDFPAALAAVADATLSEMGNNLGALSKRFSRPGVEDRLHESATRIWMQIDVREILPGGVDDGTQDTPENDTTTAKAGDAGQEAKGESEVLPGGVEDSSARKPDPAPQSKRPTYFVDRLKLLRALRRERDGLLDPQEGDASTEPREISELLGLIAVHPKTVDLIRAYVDSPIKGTAAILEQIRIAVGAISELKARLTSKETAEDAWGYAPLVVSAVTSLGLSDVSGLPEFAVAAGQVLSRT
ncbi:MAG: hypothetical protein LH624_18750, partial [Cryobacterium sp.]|nr:hypothetical protein [Cryobacterium sp.]